MTGLDVEIGKALAGKMGVAMALVPIPPPTIDGGRPAQRRLEGPLHGLGQGRRDAARAGQRRLQKRVDKVALFAPYYRELVAVAYDKTKIPDLNSLDVFRDRKVGVEIRTVADQYLITTSNHRLHQQRPPLPHRRCRLRGLQGGECRPSRRSATSRTLPRPGPLALRDRHGAGAGRCACSGGTSAWRSRPTRPGCAMHSANDGGRCAGLARCEDLRPSGDEPEHAGQLSRRGPRCGASPCRSHPLSRQSPSCARRCFHGRARRSPACQPIRSPRRRWPAMPATLLSRRSGRVRRSGRGHAAAGVGLDAGAGQRARAC